MDLSVSELRACLHQQKLSMAKGLSYPPPKLIFTECLYAAENLSLPGGWPSFAPQVSQLLTNHVKAFSPRGVTPILQKGWPYPRVTRQGEVKLMQIWFAQGCSAGIG